MASIEVIMSEREPGIVQLFATGIDAGVACLGGSVQTTWWIPLVDARKLHRSLGDKRNISEGGTS